MPGGCAGAPPGTAPACSLAEGAEHSPPRAPCPAQPYQTPRALALPYQELPGYLLVVSSAEKTSQRPDGQHGPALGSAWGLAALPAGGGSAVPGHLQACIVAGGIVCQGGRIMSLCTGKVWIFLPAKLFQKYEMS